MNIDTNNLDVAKLMQILSAMDKKELEEGIAKASNLLKNSGSSDILNNLNNKS